MVDRTVLVTAHNQPAVLAAIDPFVERHGLQGPLEGHINRLKLLKRSMYGRAKLPLLRARMLQVAERESARATSPIGV